jgi:transposase-like protein
MNNLDKLMFHDDDKAREWLEARVWPHGPVCPHCGATKGLTRMQGLAHRDGAFQCNQCRGQFTVTVNTVFERSKVPLHTWLHALYLMNASKKGMSAHQIHRMIGVSYKTAWFMCHRIRAAMDAGSFAAPLGGEGKIVEADETYFGKVEEEAGVTDRNFAGPYKKGRRGPAGKRAVVALVERGGPSRTFHVDNCNKATVQRIVRENVAPGSHLHTDESNLYNGIESHVAAHETVKHTAGEYVRGNVTSNHVENYFSVFKRGMKGVYQHCGEKHLHRYLAEFDFRYSNRAALGVNDVQRTEKAAAGIAGKRLTYRGTSSAA